MEDGVCLLGVGGRETPDDSPMMAEGEAEERKDAEQLSGWGESV